MSVLHKIYAIFYVFVYTDKLFAKKYCTNALKYVKY